MYLIFILLFVLIDSPKLVALHNNFLECLEENPMKIVTFAESLPTEFTALKVPILCVPKDAAGEIKLFYEHFDMYNICFNVYYN